MTRYLSGLCVAGLGLCGGGWLIVAAVAFAGEDGGGAGKVNLATGAGLILVSCASAAAWTVAWRRRLRADGVLVERFTMVSRREARRNRRELARDVRRTSRLSKRSARNARRGARRSARLAGRPVPGGPVPGGPVPGGPAFGGGPSASGAAYNGNAHNGDVPSENSPNRNAPHGPALGGPGLSSTGFNSVGLNENSYVDAGLDGVSAADVLGELRNLRALLGPLLTATERQPVPPPLPVRQPQQSWHAPSLPAQAGAAHAQAAQAGAAQARAAHAQAAQAGAAQARAAQAQAAQAQAAQPRQAGGLLAGDDELRMLADSEEAWW
jgi:hypothetical protein